MARDLFVLTPMLAMVEAFEPCPFADAIHAAHWTAFARTGNRANAAA